MLSSLRNTLLIIGLVVTLSACTTDQLTAFGCTFDNDPMTPRSPECLAIDRQQDEAARLRRLEREAEQRSQRTALDLAREELPRNRASLANVTLVGSYYCGQGKTALRLDTGRVRNGAIPAVFYFYPDPGNPGVPSGSFHVDVVVDATTGTTSEGREYAAYDVHVQPVEWIDRPDGYVMVPMAGRLGSTPTPPYLAVIKGQVQAEGCSSFELTEVLE